MKKKNLIVATVTLALLFVTAFGSPAMAKEFVLGTLGANLDHPQMKSRIDFMKECFKVHGYDLTVIHLPALRSLEAASRGQTDGDLFREYTLNAQNEFPELVRVECPLSYYPLFAFVSNPDIKAKGIKGVKGLAEYRVITMRGDRIMEKMVNPQIPKDKLTIVASYEQGFKMLAAGRADVVVSDRAKAGYYIDALGLKDKISMVTPPLLLLNLYTYVNKKHAALAVEIVDTMKAKMADGTYLKMIGVPPPKPEKS